MAGDPTFAEAWNQFKQRIWQHRILDQFLNANTPNWLQEEEDLSSILKGQFVADGLAISKAERKAMQAILTPGALQRAYLPYLREIGRSVDIPDTEIGDLMFAIRNYMVENSQTINSRNLTFGTPSAGAGNVGNGVVKRLTVDEDNFPLEGVFLENKKLTCESDQNQGRQYREVFRFEGETAEPDHAFVKGSGASKLIASLSEDDSAQWLQNPAFSDFTGTTPTAGSPTTLVTGDEFPGWTVTTPSAAQANVDQTFRGGPSTETPISVLFTGNNKLSQTLKDTINPEFNPRIPIYRRVAIRRTGLADGTLTVRFGAVSFTQAVTGLTNDQWSMVIPTIGQNSWLKQFNQADLKMEIEWSGRTTGSLYIHEVMVHPFENLDGTWYVIDGGTTDWLKGDSYSWSDALVASEAIIQWALWRAGLLPLPSDNAGTETIVDPS